MKKLLQISLEPSVYQRTKLLETRPGNGIPSEINVEEEIGRGSNNRVYTGIHKCGTKVVIRCPRRKSDTERAGYATWEFRHTLTASNLGVAPALYDAWYVRHAKTKQRAGLHIISEFFPCDGQDAFTHNTEEVITYRDQIEEQICSHLKTLAEADMLCYDLKPGNIVLNLEDPVKVRFIDFGREFCEQNHLKDDNTERTPITSFIKTLASLNSNDEEETNNLYQHLLFLTMLVLLSSNTSYFIHSIRHKINADKELRNALNIISHISATILENTRGRIIKLLKKILRQEDIKSICRHYMSRRNSGTRKILHWAVGEE
jgi:tRNA A-37 threonylcarbamoyl transferase component Bud32